VGRPRFPFSELFASARSRAEVVVTFLALLELIRMKLFVAVQTEQFGEIEVELAPTPPPGATPQAPESATDGVVSEDTLPPQSPPADIVEPTPPRAPDQLPEANPVGSDNETPQTA
jgi:hypothetical protein